MADMNIAPDRNGQTSHGRMEFAEADAGRQRLGSAQGGMALPLGLSGDTRVYPIIGDPIGQVKSPAALTAIFSTRGENAIVVPFHVVANDATAVVLTLLRVRNIGGVLVTLPHKVAALGECATATERARFIGATNVMRRSGAGWHGDNTDGCGYADGLAKAGFDIAGKSALLVGCGGAGSAIAFELLRRGAARLALHDVDAQRRDRLIARLAERFPGKVMTGSRDPRSFDLVANATPMGMKASDPMPVEAGLLEPRQFVACAITRPRVSPIVAAARQRGCPTMTGDGMFDAQAERLVDFLLAKGEENA
jgi:shikimate dehydrogenase